MKHEIFIHMLCIFVIVVEQAALRNTLQTSGENAFMTNSKDSTNGPTLIVDDMTKMTTPIEKTIREISIIRVIGRQILLFLVIQVINGE